MAAGYPAPQAVYIPSHEASGSLVIEFSRNPTKFSLNQYVKLVPVQRDVGYYLRITAEEAARVLDSTDTRTIWADGQEAPMGDDNLESHEFDKYVTQRRAFPFTIGQKTVAQASWDIVASHARIAAQKAMTSRTFRVNSVLTTGANWGANTSTSSALVGGYLDQSTETTMLIQSAFLQVAEAILKATLGVVTQGDVVAVMNPTTARRLAKSPEIVNHIKQSPFALAQVRGDVPNQNGKWGLPDTLYGTKLVIEDAVKVTTKKGASSTTRAFIHPDGSILFVSRPEGITGTEGTTNFATVTLFVYEEMSVEQMSDVNNRRIHGRVVDDYATEITAPASGYLLTSVLSS